MTTAVVDRVMASAPLDLRHSEVALLTCLARLAGPDGRLRWPCGTSQLVRMTRYSEASVKRARRELVNRGLVRLPRRGDGLTRTEYVVCVPVQEAAESPPAPVTDRSERPPSPVTVTPPYLDSQGSTPNPKPAAPVGGRRPCPKATRRGRPCGRCRACGTNPRAERRAAQLVRPPWCGRCDERTRHVELEDGAGGRCGECHPLAARPVDPVPVVVDEPAAPPAAWQELRHRLRRPA